MTSKREILVSLARKEYPRMGDDCMIAEMEWGYWVGGGGGVYVTEKELQEELTKNMENIIAELENSDWKRLPYDGRWVDPVSRYAYHAEKAYKIMKQNKE
jgi:hypothetical protein